MKKFILAALAVIVAALLVVVIFKLPSFSQSGAPSVPTFNGSGLTITPQAKADVQPVFGWRTGDVIPITVYVEQPPGITVDPESYALTVTNNDDIQATVVSTASVTSANGARVYIIKVNVQTWSYKKSFKVQAAVSYIRNSSQNTATLTLPAVTVHMSPTWDGQQMLQDGTKPTFNNAQLSHNSGLLLLGLFGLLGSFLFIRLARKKNSRHREQAIEEQMPLQVARERVKELRTIIADGGTELAFYEELEQIVRSLFNIEALTTDKVDAVLSVQSHWAQAQIVAILSECDKRLYGDIVLASEDNERIFAAFKFVFKHFNDHIEPSPIPPTKAELTIARVVEISLAARAWSIDVLHRASTVPVLGVMIKRAAQVVRWFVALRPIRFSIRLTVRLVRFIARPLVWLVKRPLKWVFNHPFKWTLVRLAPVGRWAWLHRPFRYYR